METVVLDIGSIHLADGEEYIVLLHVPQSGVNAFSSVSSSDPYPDGGLFLQRNLGDRQLWSMQNWARSINRDLALELTFEIPGPTPEEIAAALAAEAARIEAQRQDDLASVTAASGTSARLIVIRADGVVRDAGQVSIATRDTQLVLTRVAGGDGARDVTVSTQGALSMMGNLFTWAEVTGFRSDTFGSGDGTLIGSGLQIGADIALGPDMVAGLSLGYSTIEASDASVTSEGSYTYLQPYLSYRSGPWHGTASLMYGMGAFTQTSLVG